MCKLLAIISICLALSVVRSDSTTCADTTNLRTLYGLSNSLSTPQTYSDINYCKSIKSGPVCCTNTDMNTFQTKAEKILTNLSSVAGARDKFLYNAVYNVLPNLKTTVSTFKTTYASLGSTLTTFAALASASAGSSGFGDYGSSGSSGEEFDIDDLLTGLTNVTDYLNANGGDLKAQYTSYQKARATCITQMVKFQTAAFCLSCDPSAASKGYSYVNGYNNIDISDTVCKRIDTACSSYFTTAFTMSAVSQIAASVQVLTNLNDFTAKIQKLAQSGDTNGLLALITTMDSLFGSSVTDVTTGPVEPICDPNVDNSCTNFCDTLFDNGQIDQQALALAGKTTDLGSFYESGRLLNSPARSESRNDGGRMLDNSNFDPDEEESGVSVTFEQDPAGTQKTSTKFGSLSFGNVFVSMMVVISAILLF